MFSRSGPWWALCVGLSVACGSTAPVSKPAPAGVDAASWSRWEGCAEDTTCKSGVMLDVLRRDAAVAAVLVQSESVVEVRWTLVTAAIRANPERSRSLCRVVGDAALEQRCQQQTSRPHLYARPPNEKPIPTARTAVGPPTATLVLRLNDRSRFTSVPPQPGNCSAGSTQIMCLSQVASRLASDGKAEAAAAACMAIPPADTWRGECAFQAAEVFAQRCPAEQVDQAVELCWLSSEWAGRCVDKVHQGFAQRAPSANGDAAAWAPMKQGWHAMSLAWARQGETMQAIAEGAFWSTVVTSAYRRVDTPTGAPLDHLPEAAHPHVRAAAAWAMMRFQPGGGSSLAETTEALRAVLAARPEPSQTAPRPNPHSAPRGNYWAVDEGEDGLLPATQLYGVSRRILAPDLDDDLQICVLEAAARNTKAWRPIIKEALSSPSPLVAETARRLTKALDRPPPRRPASASH